MIFGLTPSSLVSSSSKSSRIKTIPGIAGRGLRPPFCTYRYKNNTSIDAHKHQKPAKIKTLPPTPSGVCRINMACLEVQAQPSGVFFLKGLEMEAPKFTIKKVDLRVPANQTTLSFLQKKILPEDTPYQTDRGHWWVAYAECGKPVAFAGLVRSTRWTDTGYLCRAGVLENFTGHGLQKRLIQVRQRKAKELGWNWLITDTTDNPASSNSLISAGFKMYTPANPWSFKNACYWKYKVNQDAVQRQERKKKQTQRVQP